MDSFQIYSLLNRLPLLLLHFLILKGLLCLLELIINILNVIVDHLAIKKEKKTQHQNEFNPFYFSTHKYI